MGISNMKLLILSTICISSIASFRISESEAKLVLSRERRWGRSNEQKADDKMKKRCGKETCAFEEWAETAENYNADGWDEENVRSPEKVELFEKMYSECVGGATGSNQEVVNARVSCVMNVKSLFNNWPTQAPVVTEAETTTTAKATTTDNPVAMGMDDVTTDSLESLPTTNEQTTTTAKPTTEPTTAEPTTTTSEPTTEAAPTTTTTEAPTTVTTEEPTTTTKRRRTKKPRTKKPIDNWTDDWATTVAPRRRNRGRG